MCKDCRSEEKLVVTHINELFSNGDVVSDPKLIAETFNDYFINIGPNLAAEINDESYDEESQLDDSASLSSDTQFHFSQINVSSVTLTLTLNLKANKATGLDKIPAKMFKLLSDIIAQSITAVFNLSLGTGMHIDEWKHARVTPIFRSDDRRKYKNYRPISILPIISKVFEKEICVRYIVT